MPYCTLAVKEPPLPHPTAPYWLMSKRGRLFGPQRWSPNEEASSSAPAYACCRNLPSTWAWAIPRTVWDCYRCIVALRRSDCQALTVRNADLVYSACIKLTTSTCLYPEISPIWALNNIDGLTAEKYLITKIAAKNMRVRIHWC